VLDPDADTGIDAQVLTQVPAFRNAPVVDVQVGTLHLDSLAFVTRPQHAFDIAGRRIAGVLGREVFTSSLVFGFSRDEGIAWLATPKHARELAQARAVDFYFRKKRNAPTEHPLIAATVDGQGRELQIDLGRVDSRLRTRFWPAGAVAEEHHTVIDAAGTHHETEVVTTAKSVQLGAIERFDVRFVDYQDSYVLPDELDGTVALDALFDLDVAVSFDSHRLYVAARHEVARATRIARWSMSCKHLGCAELVLHGRALEVRPEQTPAQLIVRATSSYGAPLPTLEVDLDRGADHFAVELDDRYTDAVLDVIDASPFPRTCSAEARGCVVPAQP